METKEIKRRGTRGITLIALVVTIIVLLILAGVAINLSIGQNGVILKAINAREENEKAEIIEKIQFDIADKQLQNQEIINEEEFYEILERYGTISGDNNTLTTTKGNYEILIKDIYNGSIKSSIPEGLDIGDIVKYNPSGFYNWKRIYYSSDKDYEDIEMNSGDGEEFNIKTWKVFSISNGKIRLIASNPTIGQVYLGQAQGYNNGVKLLNDACSNLYGNIDKNIYARNINMEDIESVMNEEALNIAYNYSSIIDGTKYNNQDSVEYTNKYYPMIYKSEKLSVINKIKNIDGILRSQQDTFIEDDNNGGFMQAATMQPYQTYWSINNIRMKTAFKEINDSNYYNFIMPKDINTNYWIASRCVPAYSGSCDFSVYCARDGAISAEAIFSSDNTTGRIVKRSIFPIITISGNLIKGNDTEGWFIE